jgi:hypothetical protein
MPKPNWGEDHEFDEGETGLILGILQKSFLHEISVSCST